MCDFFSHTAEKEKTQLPKPGVFVSDPHDLLSSALLFESLAAIACYSREGFEYKRLFIQHWSPTCPLPSLSTGLEQSHCRVINCLAHWMWHGGSLSRNKLGLDVQDGFRCPWNEATFPLGSLRKSNVISEDVLKATLQESAQPSWSGH